jgi:hypothetical protein
MNPLTLNSRYNTLATEIRTHGIKVAI